MLNMTGDDTHKGPQTTVCVVECAWLAHRPVSITLLFHTTSHCVLCHQPAFGPILQGPPYSGVWSSRTPAVDTAGPGDALHHTLSTWMLMAMQYVWGGSEGCLAVILCLNAAHEVLYSVTTVHGFFNRVAWFTALFWSRPVYLLVLASKLSVHLPWKQLRSGWASPASFTVSVPQAVVIPDTVFDHYCDVHLQCHL